MSKSKNHSGVHRRLKTLLLTLSMLGAACLGGCLDPSGSYYEPESPGAPIYYDTPETTEAAESPVVTLGAIPAYSGDAYVVIDGNVPYFTGDDIVKEAFEDYSQLDYLGRCGVAYACISQELMPTEDRGSISSVTPSGWINAVYDFIDGGYLYNRCHLIGFQLTGENANKCNLITGTRYLNIQGMLPFENMTADHILEEDHHVLYRVTPFYDGTDLVASGVQIEAYCIECGEDAESDLDKFMFNVYCYNVQPGVVIDYATGESSAGEIVFTGEDNTYILNTSSMKFHLEGCSGANAISDANREVRTCTREELVFQGYVPCGSCDP